jgi:hypothetical protein
MFTCGDRFGFSRAIRPKYIDGFKLLLPDYPRALHPGTRPQPPRRESFFKRVLAKLGFAWDVSSAP